MRTIDIALWSTALIIALSGMLYSCHMNQETIRGKYDTLEQCLWEKNRTNEYCDDLGRRLGILPELKE